MKRLVLIVALMAVLAHLSATPARAFCFGPNITDQAGCLDQCQCEADWCYADATTWSERYDCHQAQQFCNQDCKDFFGPV